MIEFLKDLPWTSAASIVFGATISALVSFFLQKNAFAETRRQKEADRYEIRRGQAYSLFFKMVRIHSSIALIEHSMSELIRNAEASDLQGPLWQRMLPMGNLPPRVKFSSDEMALLLPLDSELFNDLGSYDDVHNSLLDLLELYGRKRSTMTEKFNVLMKGGIATAELTREEAEWMAPRAYELNDLAETIVNRLVRDSVESKSLLERMHVVFVKEYKLNPKLEFKAFQ